MSMDAAPTRRTFQPWNDPDAKPLIEFQAVTKRYGAVTAVDNLSLSIYEREFFALLGPSGCGKTTLMRMLAGFEEANEGRVMLAGKDLAGVPPYRRPVNMMFQSYALFPHMSVEANIAYGLKQEGMAKVDIAERVERMLTLVKMQAFAKRKPDQLSGGQRQRVALARSLAKQPKVLLLDEPLGALDRKLREETQFELIDLQEQLGITFMVVTHDQEEAMTMADRIAVMDHGRIVQIASPETIYERPANRYVADFIGDINMIAATVAGTEGDFLQLTSAAGQSLLANASGVAPATGDAVHFAMRPEKVSIAHASSQDDESAANTFTGEVWDIAYLGGQTHYKVKLDDGTFVRTAVLNDHVGEARPITWEDRVVLSCPPGSALVLAE